MTRRDLMKILLGTAIAEAVDVERLLWTPKPIITVPAMGTPVYRVGRDGIRYMIGKLPEGVWTNIACDLRSGERIVMGDQTVVSLHSDVPSEEAMTFTANLKPYAPYYAGELKYGAGLKWSNRVTEEFSVVGDDFYLADSPAPPKSLADRLADYKAMRRAHA